MIGKGEGEEGRLLKAEGGDGDKGKAVTRATGAPPELETPAACRLQQARAGCNKQRISASEAGGGGGAAGVSRSGTPAAST